MNKKFLNIKRGKEKIKKMWIATIKRDIEKIKKTANQTAYKIYYKYIKLTSPLIEKKTYLG